MKGSKIYKLLLVIAFIGLLVFFIGLNVFGGQKQGLPNLIVNGAMFVITGWILLSCERKTFSPLEKIEELNKAADLNILTPKIGEVIKLRDEKQQFTKWWKEIK